MGKSREGGVYPGAWVVPGGGIDDGETELEALKREVMEEVAIDIEEAKITKIEGGASSGSSQKTLRETNETVNVQMQFNNYIVRLPRASADVEMKTEDDFEQATWFTSEEVKNLELSPPTESNLKSFNFI